MESLFLYAFILNPVLLYTIAAVGLMLEANTILFTIGFLTSQGLFESIIVLPLALIASVIGNIFWYYYGVLWGNHWNPYSKVMAKLASPFDAQIQKSLVYTIALTKFVYALNCAIVIRAGTLRLPFLRFLLADIITAVIWIAVVWPFGYFSGNLASVTASRFHYVEVGLLLAVLLFLLVKHYLAKRLKEKLVAESAPSQSVEGQKERENVFRKDL